MKHTFSAIALVLGTIGASPALASDDDYRCNAPLSEWQPVEALRSNLVAEGWTVNRIKTDDGCYEAYAIDDQGRRVEAYFDPKTLDMVKMEIED